MLLTFLCVKVEILRHLYRFICTFLTKVQDSISDVELNLNGLNLFMNVRLFSKGGECMLYVEELNVCYM